MKPLIEEVLTWSCIWVRSLHYDDILCAFLKKNDYDFQHAARNSVK